MIVIYHPSVQRDVNRILRYYQDISGRLADEFWDELLERIAAAMRKIRNTFISLKKDFAA
jgi:hypothetical protein